MLEVKERGEIIIRLDVLITKHNLNERQGKAVDHLLQNGKLTIQDHEKLCPDVNPRSLQRDLKGLLGKNLIIETGTAPTDPTRYYVLSRL